MRVLWLLGEMGVPFECQVWPFDRTLRSADYMRRSPAGRVPSIEDGGLTLFESGAIVEYLCERYPESGLGRLTGDSERWQWLMWIHYAETVGQHLANLTQHHIFLREDWMRSPTFMRLEKLRLDKTLGALESTLDTRDWLLASGFSAADCCVGYCVYVASFFTDLHRFPNVKAYRGRMFDRTAFRASIPGPGDERLYRKEHYPVPDVSN